MRSVLVAIAAAAVLVAATCAFAQDKPAEPAPVPKAEEKKPAEAAPAAKPAGGEDREDWGVPGVAPAPVVKPEEKKPVEAAPTPVVKPEEKKPAEAAPAAPPAPVVKPEDKKPAETPTPVVKPEEKKPAEVAPAVLPAPPKPEPAPAAAEGVTPLPGAEGVKVEVEPLKAPEAEKKPIYGGSTIAYTNTTGVNPDIPYYAMSVKLLPKLNITDEFAISARLDLIKELTNGISTTAKRETQFGDLRLELVHTNLYKEKHSGIQFSGLARVTFPTSKASQFATLRLSSMADLGIGRTFFDDKLSVGYDFRFYKYFHEYTTAEYVESSGGTYTDASGRELNVRVLDGKYLDTGEINPDYQMAHIFAASYAFTEKLSAIVYFWVINARTYEPTGGGPRGHRDSIDFNVEIDYAITKWLMVDVGIDTLQPQLTPDSTYPGNPFYRNTASNFTSVYFDIAVSL
ncbi:MAG: hypothetical protein HY897_08685 [Deltaproteobacteria bacterium]|nr:hypothetical protein [Deltaproteobacteria bacterium]